MTASLNNLGDPDVVPMKTGPLEAVLSQVRGTRACGNGWTAFCPAHNDRNERSLSINSGEEGRVLVHCFAGCTTERIANALGLTMADLFVRESKGWASGNSNGRQGGREVTPPPPNRRTDPVPSDPQHPLASSPISCHWPASEASYERP